MKLNAALDLIYVQRAEALLREFKDVFAWSYQELKGIPAHIAEHRIELNTSMPPAHQARYWTNPNYASIVKHDLDKLLAAGFIEPIKETTWLSPIVIVPKKNGKLRICVDFMKLNVATRMDPYPLPFIENVLDHVAGQEAISICDGNSGYYQIWICKQDG